MAIFLPLLHKSPWNFLRTLNHISLIFGFSTFHAGIALLSLASKAFNFTRNFWAIKHSEIAINFKFRFFIPVFIDTTLSKTNCKTLYMIFYKFSMQWVRITNLKNHLLICALFWLLLLKSMFFLLTVTPSSEMGKLQRKSVKRPYYILWNIKRKELCLPKHYKEVHLSSFWKKWK